MPQPLLEVENLQVQFRTDDGLVKAVEGISFELAPGETLGIVGESGSGKSVTNLALLGLIPKPPGIIAGGTARFHGNDLLRMSQRQLSHIRGHEIAMVFQDPLTSLNPFLTIAEQLTEVTRLHLKFSRSKALRHAIEMLERVGIPAPERRIHDFPHQFSGGMRQRVMIAMALSCKPQILIADEPTTALDVTIQAQIMEMMKSLQKQEGTAIILITHDLGVVANFCRRVNVMYAGKFVEEAATDALFAQPRHPYTLGLLNSIPRLHGAGSERLVAIPGQPPDLIRLPPGCSFRPRCPFSVARCELEVPPLDPAPHGGRAACFVDVTTAPQHEPIGEAVG
ncbi:MAG TPA: ABC transporter ATP-binding protein [Pirellulales bacterium]|jgi:oligopeptide transport system ATP-binding protein|nr:ABC transporter ATP-binding protein [Pirellulales bacterium]